LWPVRLEDGFFDLVKVEQPGGLNLLAHHCVFMKEMEGFWYFKGRPAKLFMIIVDVLDCT
jgi:hypothetical protein